MGEASGFWGYTAEILLCQERDRAADPTSWEIRGTDKVLPALASFPPDVLELYSKIDYRMGNQQSSEFLERAFAREDGTTWDYVFNFAPEYKFGQSKQVYEQHVGSFVHLSSAHIFKADGNTKHKEDSELEAPNALAESYIEAEDDLKQIPELPLNVVPMLIMAQISKVEGEKMDVLWDKALRVNTVHVDDVALAALKVAQWHKGKQGTAVFNLSDPGDTTNSHLAKCVGKLFDIELSFQNAAINFIVKRLRTAELTEEVNGNIANSQLSPYLDQEHPYCTLEKYPLGVDGSLITSIPEIGFKYSYETFKNIGLWPKV
ncbi:hypothetical protein DL89DRAFT_293581 [Linderina pennispora]|uniref:NAD(P)-binding protein n=1 Tax=Linderina pennispora TaxID=61395 RepID=A0A1Y1W6J1_9FUNG|nr:uncharacterized protein DL89DRAFT_293581 [Linderina pennispora]ORX69131.1 hypothetical protein DL89DRAFT_293581 [Linderina pennispora]